MHSRLQHPSFKDRSLIRREKECRGAFAYGRCKGVPQLSAKGTRNLGQRLNRMSLVEQRERAAFELSVSKR